MRRIILFFIIFLFTIILINKLSSLDNIDIVKKGKTYCLIIALDQYQNRLTLENHKVNAIKLKNTLYNNYEIDEVMELYDFDATKAKIEASFFKLQKDLKEADSLIIYYSGHSYIDQNENESYWLPYDAGINEYSKEFWISNNDINKLLKKMNSSQILLLNDANFNLDYIELMDIDDSIKFTMEYFEKAYSKKTGLFLGSGISEIGKSKSEFSELLISVLDKMKGKYIDAINIYNEIKIKMKESIPVLGTIKDLKQEKNGSFVLLPRKNEIVKLEEKEKEETIQKEEKIENQNKEEKIKKEEEKVQITKKEKETIIYQPKINLDSINIAGNVLLVIGTSLTTVGISVFIIDLLILFPEVRYRMSDGTTYADYEFYYNINLTVFSASIASTVIGLGLTAAGIGLKIYAFHQKKLAFNLEYNNNIKIYFSYKF